MDIFETHSAGLSSPAINAAAVTPSDAEPLAQPSRALYVGGDGDVSVVMMGGGTVTFSGVAAGSLLPIRVAYVRATATTATDILAIW